MTLRKQVSVQGLPYRWTTNLNDADIREFHAIYSEIIKEPLEAIDDKSSTIVIRFRLDFLSFSDGFCVWNATGNEHTVLYRSNRDWDLWSARQKEIEELRQEQATDEAIEKQLVLAEDSHLEEKTKVAKQSGEWAAATGYVIARVLSYASASNNSA